MIFRLAGAAIVVALLYWGAISFAHAHDAWANGDPIPAWVKASCCGPADAHHLRPDQVHDEGEFYRVDGYNRPIPRKEAQPSLDGDYWIFYKENTLSGGQSGVYCFFLPMNI